MYFIKSLRILNSKEVKEYRTPHQIELAKIVQKYADQYEGADYKEAKEMITQKAENTFRIIMKTALYFWLRYFGFTM